MIAKSIYTQAECSKLQVSVLHADDKGQDCACAKRYPKGMSYLRPTVRPRGRCELTEKCEGPSTSMTTCKLQHVNKVVAGAAAPPHTDNAPQKLSAGAILALIDTLRLA